MAWVCQVCGANNFPGNQSCFKCQQWGRFNTRGGSHMNRADGHSNRGNAQPNRGGGFNTRGGSHMNRGGGHSNRGNAQPNRGGGFNTRGGSHMNRGGGHSNRGNAQPNRGGGFNTGGGSHMNRGGGHSNRGNAQPNRGGGFNTRGGSHMNRGGGHSNRGNAQPNRGGGFNTGGGSHTDNMHEVSQFLNMLQKQFQSPKLVCNRLDTYLHLWLKSWSNYHRLNVNELEILFTSFAMLPSSFEVPQLPPLQCCTEAVDRFFTFLQDCSEICLKIEMVLKLVQRMQLVKIWSENSQEDVCNNLTQILSHCNKSLDLTDEDHFAIFDKIKIMILELRKPWSVSVENKSSTKTEEVAESSVWIQATVKWLADPKKFQYNYLPVMKVPKNASKGVYPNIEDYFQTIESLWIGLTFCDGNSTLNPKCRFKNKQNLECGQVLLSVKKKEAPISCCNYNCIGNVTRKCLFHNGGLCQYCFDHAQKNLMGPPGNYASTNIYDCHVAHVNCEGMIFMKSLKSRRPPQTPIHWRSTRRLACSNLIGLVKLSSPWTKLCHTDAIIWAEVVNHANPRDEFKERESGKIVVSLKNLSGLNKSDEFQVGVSVAVIDCFTFVPEHIPVLKAIEMQKQSPLPFQGGALLNLCGKSKKHTTQQQRFHDDIVLSESSLDNESSSEDEIETMNISAQIDEMIEKSHLDPIVQIRKVPRKSLELKWELSRLINKATLDSQQMESFLEALQHPVHLTQGPPGTGKSYIGVVLVRALLLIRRKWMKVSPSIGEPPILVLSYKNHAIDEFLADLISQEMHLTMIRTGSCDHPDVQSYSEKNHCSYNNEKREKKLELQTLSDKKLNLIAQIKHLSPLMTFESILTNRNDINYESQSYGATQYLCKLIMNLAIIKEYFDPEGEKTLSELYDQLVSENQRICSPQIHALYEGIKHCNIKNIEEVIYRWILGFEPQKCCLQCKNTVHSKTHEYCKDHACLSHHDSPEHCLLARKQDHHFCEKHACRVEACMTGKTITEQIYCEDHICFVCVKENIIANLATDDPPRNTCSNHQLCSSQEGQEFCLNLSLPNVKFCEKHKNATCSALTNGSMCTNFVESRGDSFCKKHLSAAKEEHMFKFNKCEGVNKRNQPCGTKLEMGLRYCKAHALTVPKSTTVVSISRNCKGRTKKKKPCKKKAQAGYDYCEVHVKNLPATLVYPHEIKPLIENVGVLDGGIETSESKINELKKNDVNMQEEEASKNKTNVEVQETQDEKNGKEGTFIQVEEKHKSCQLVDLADVGGKNLSKEEIDYFESSVDTKLIQESPLPDENLEKIDDEDDYEVNDELQHRKDVHGIEEQPEILIEDDPEDDHPKEVEIEDEMVSILPDMWTWSMSLEKRWEQCKLLEQQYISLLRRVSKDFNHKIQKARQEYHDATVRAKSMVYEGKSIIGGTIVGCIARLEAIRRMQPFAIVIEEASEVLEPLLFSCFTHSTCKLEMIGDHLQLQPSIMSKIMFERHNCINISMFERLINSPDGHKVPSTALATQRRMRKNICDLTRHFYDDIVEIIDHELCSSKKIGSEIKITKRNPLAKLQMCVGGGREVPGLLPNVFFWTHNDKQTKAHVGLSRVNNNECNRVVALTQYLVECGVPKPSIAVITPYKGQLMLLRKHFMNISFISKFDRSNSVRVSTVDRFQGDEADVVIISLVIDANSHTPFVKKVNRMIVLLSRARLGMYIVGNIGYFEEKRDTSIEHWNKTIEKLREPGVQDTDGASVAENVESLVFDGPRCGDELPICCPIHRDNFMLTDSVSKLALNFCKEKCPFDLPCSHSCGLPCHFSNPSGHNQQCLVVINPPPCHIHKGNWVTCHDVYQNVQKRSCRQLNVNKMLNDYRCPSIVDVQLPCTHVVQMSCAEECDIQQGSKSYPECQQLSLVPYSYSKCRHDKQVLCCSWYEYMKDPSKVPLCREKVTYTPPCSHNIQLDCCAKQNIENQNQPFLCTQTVALNLPRCGHPHTISCQKAETISKWKGVSCTPGTVYEGTSYGPVDHICNVGVNYIRVCGHEKKLQCDLAFQYAPNVSNCDAKVTINNPDCGHPVQLLCAENRKLSSQQSKTPVTYVKEGTSSSVFGNLLQTNCKSKVQYERRCGHTEDLECRQARDERIQPCSQNVSISHPVCGHSTTVKCSKQTEVMSWKPWPVGVSSNTVLLNGILKDTCPPPEILPKHLETVIKPCKEKVCVERSCKHVIEGKCEAAFHGLQGKNVEQPCLVQVSAQLTCGHFKSVSCFDFTHSNFSNITCNEDITMKCWNYSLCRNIFPSKCCNVGRRIDCGKNSNWVCQNGHVNKDVRVCTKGYLTHCPECVLEQILEEKAFFSSQKIHFDVPKEMKTFKRIDIFTKEKQDELTQNLGIVVERYHGCMKYRNALKRILFSPRFVPCFHYQDFAMKISTLHGMQVYEWTANNVKHLIEAAKTKEHMEIFCGVAYCIQGLVNPSNVPGKKKRDKLKDWCLDQVKAGYDCVQRQLNGMDEIVLFRPFAAVSTHKLTLTRSQLQDIIECGFVQKQRFTEELIRFEFPPGARSDLADAKTMAEQKLPKAYMSGWDEKSLGGFSDHVQKELMSKLRFCGAEQGLFNGINYLKKLSSEDAPANEIPLLKALELIKLDDLESATDQFKEYKKLVQQKKFFIHPLSILAEARLFHSQNETGKENLLENFSLFFPDAAETWFEECEFDLIEKQTDETDQKHKNEEDLRNEMHEEWEEFKSEEGIQSEAMDNLISMIGLKKVKMFAIKLFKSAVKFRKLDEVIQKANPKTLNFCFLGNAGSGKTTVARLLAKILHDSTMRFKDTFVETSAQHLKNEGPKEFEKLVQSATDGVLFIDEAYDLDPKGDLSGKPIVTELLTVAENKRDSLSLILAGYHDDMEEKLFSYNEGIKSRFEMVYFEDFDETDLKAIWAHQIKERKFFCDKLVGNVVAKRLAKLSGKKGFGNARAVRNEVEKAIQNAMAREDFDEKRCEVHIKDVLGELPTNNPKLKAILDEFDGKVGWKSIKKSVTELINTCEKNFELQMSGLKTLPVMLNRCFLGNPGTGKTTCAKLYGRLLKELNFLTVGEVVMSSASDFVGSHVGESQTKTNLMLEKARGKVLVIDEAYNLNDGLYGKQVLDVLVEKVQNTESDDIAVLLLGYEDKMREMLRDQNPGLARRFAMDYAFMFDDYTEDELYVILQGVCKRENIHLTTEVAQVISKELEKQRSQANFGNAGAIDNVIRSALAKATSRPLSADKRIKLIPTDIAPDIESTQDPLSPLENLYKMEKVRLQIIEIRNTFEVAESEGSKEKPELGHFVFRGSPGTGKTTVARVMAEIFHGLGLIARNHVEETSGLGLTGEHVGHTKKRVQEKLDAARGGVLFIDEAYEFGRGGFGEEAITTLVAAMTDPNYKMVVIIAGYPKDMEDMLGKNVGLKSRFKRFLDFPDWDSDDCIKFLTSKASGDNFAFPDDVQLVIKRGIETISRFPGWGNARDAKAIWNLLLEQRANRVYDKPELLKTIELSDANKVMFKMINDRRPRATPQEMASKRKAEQLIQSLYQTQDNTHSPPNMQQAQDSKHLEVSTEPSSTEDCNKVIADDVDRDSGVDEEVWKQLQADKLAAEEEEKRKLDEEKRIQEEKERLLEELRQRLLAERDEEKRKKLEMALKLKREDERKRRELIEKKRREEALLAEKIQEKLRQISPCPAGFRWIKQSSGWRCAGGSHYVSDSELSRSFTS